MARAAFAFSLLLLGACDAPGGPPRVDPSECAFGRHFAECGDDVDADPVFACAGERCRWYSGGAVSADVTEVSACPPDDVCCEAGLPDRGWPFPVGDDAEHNRAAYWLFYGLDQLPWDRERAMNLAVSVDASVSGSVPPSFACTGTVVQPVGYADWDPCVNGVSVFTAERAATLGLSAPAGLRARLCAHRFTDATLPQCPYARAAICAASGDLQLSRWPSSDAEVSGISFQLHAVFEDGVEVDASGVL